MLSIGDSGYLEVNPTIGLGVGYLYSTYDRPLAYEICFGISDYTGTCIYLGRMDRGGLH